MRKYFQISFRPSPICQKNEGRLSFETVHFDSASGLPDGIFSNQKSRFGYILEGLAMEDVGTLYGYLVYFTAIWYSLWLFGIIYGYLIFIFPFWFFVPRKIWQPCSAPHQRVNNGIKFSEMKRK
jgi:hypothetical protein